MVYNNTHIVFNLNFIKKIILGDTVSHCTCVNALHNHSCLWLNHKEIGIFPTFGYQMVEMGEIRTKRLV